MAARSSAARKAPVAHRSPPTTVLSLHQPLASMLAYGLQRIEGRVWSTGHRGMLWIHAASKEPTPADIQYWEELYESVHSLDGDGSEPSFPTAYPTSCLVGCVDVVDCVSVTEFERWDTVPPGAREEACAHGNGFFFLVANHRRLLLPLKMPGQHKLWTLEHSTARALWDGGALQPSELMPISWPGHRAAFEAGSAPPVGSGTPAVLATRAMTHNARRAAAKAATRQQQQQQQPSLPPQQERGCTQQASQQLPPESQQHADGSSAREITLRWYRNDGSLAELRTEDE